MKSAEHPRPTDVIIAPGLACNHQTSVMIPMAQEDIVSRGLNVACIDGISTRGKGLLYAKTPDQIYKEIRDTATSPDRTPLVVSHCLGGVALVMAMQEFPNIRGVMIAPPLGRPYDVMTHPSVLSKQYVSEGEVSINVKYFNPQFPLDFTRLTTRSVGISGEYVDQIGDLSKNFLEYTEHLHAEGRLGLVLPEHDWNTIPNSITDDWSGKTITLPGARHSLNTTNDPNLCKQKDNVSRMADFALSLWTNK